MGLSLSSYCLMLGLGLWLVGERVLAASDFRTGMGVLSGVCFALALALDLASLRAVAVSLRRGRSYRLAAGGLISASAALYAALGCLGLNLASPSVAFGWLLLLGCGLPARIAADRAFRTGPLDTERLAQRARAGFGFGAALGLVSALNYAVATHDIRKDFSYRTTSEPSEQVRELVSKLEEPVQLLLLFDRGSQVVPALKPYCDALGRLSKRLSVRVQDAALEPALLRKHGVRGNGFALLLAGKEPSQRAETFHIGEDLRDARRVLRTLDAHIANHLSVLSRPQRLVYITSGHGERSVAGDIEESRGRWLRDFEQLLARFNLRTHRLGVAEGLARSVPADAAAVLVLGPERPFLAEEAAVLRAYVERGGRVWVGLEPGVDAGLSSLLSLVGVAPAGAPVLCRESFVVRSRTAADAALIRTHRYTRHPATEHVLKKSERPYLVLVRATGLVLGSPGRAANRVIAVQSEGDCFLDLDGDLAQGASEPEGSVPLLAAATLSGVSGAVGRMVISGDGDLPTDQVLRNEANTMLALDLLRWLVGDEDMHSVATLDEDLPVLHQRTQDRSWFYLSAFGVPLPLFALAAIRFRRRQGRAAQA